MAGKTKKPQRRTPEGQESYMINLAMEQAEEQLRNHTAPAMIVGHFLKIATTKALVDLEKSRAEAKLANSKADLVEAQKRSEQIAAEALKAFKKYSGISEEEDEYDEEDCYYDD